MPFFQKRKSWQVQVQNDRTDAGTKQIAQGYPKEAMAELRFD